MIDIAAAPIVLLGCLFALMITGFSAIAWGSRIPRHADWLVGAGLVFPVAALCWAAKIVNDAGSQSTPVGRLTGWIGPTEAQGAIKVGIMLDLIGVVVSFFAMLVTLAVLANLGALERQPRRERIFGGVALGAAGTALAWVSSTPWLAFVGLGLACVGGMASMLSFWDTDEEASICARFGWERIGSLVLATTGCCGLLGGRMSWFQPAASSAQAVSKVGLDSSESIGSVLLILGLFAQFGAFPLLGWAIKPFRSNSWVRMIPVQYFPGCAAFALLLRLAPTLNSLPVVQALAWFMVGSSFLSLVSGLLQKDAKVAFTAWVASGFSLSGAVLFLAGQRAGLSLFIGMSLGAVCYSGAAAMLSSPLEAFKSRADALSRVDVSRSFGNWYRIAGLLGIAAATGLPGFVSAGGEREWVEALLRAQPLAAGAAAVALCLFATLGWKLFFILRTCRTLEGGRWGSVLLPLLVLTPAVGLLATGLITGGALPGDTDLVMPSLMNSFFDTGRGAGHAAVEENIFAWASGIVWGSLMLGIALAFSIHRKLSTLSQKPGLSEKGLNSSFFRFIVSGYRVDTAGVRLISALDVLGTWMHTWIDGSLWNRWVPQGLNRFIQRAGGAASGLDRWIARSSRDLITRFIDWPTRFLQSIQNGDVQWYLIFALGSGFAILAHFLRV